MNQFRNPWTEEQIEYLKNNYKNKTQTQIAKELKKSHTTVSKKMIELGLKTTYRAKHEWTDEDIKYLKDNYLNKTYVQIAKDLNRPLISVSKKAKKIGLDKEGVLSMKNYTKEEEEYLRANIDKLSYKDMAKHLNRKVSAIRSKCCHLNIIPSENRTKLKTAHVQFILANCDKYTDTQLASKFQVSETAIRDVRKKYGIKKTGNEVKGITYIEQFVMDFLNELKVEFVFNEFIEDYKPDFLIKDKKIIIEVQGDYFHCNPYLYEDGPEDEIQIKHVIRDYYKKCYFLSNGYEYIEIWENDIKKKPNEVKENIKSAVLG